MGQRAAAYFGTVSMFNEKVCGTDQAQKLIEKLENTHKKRPAFIDELSKMK
ncbi:hypothetical protein [Bacillus piscicola]|uniref:hypothetical protein n=1 Tax=Bacillus piscicola TaxID=1632684 RepID=UPI001F08AC8B|nr:hypothetical protein [Bacillus piscicola]